MTFLQRYKPGVSRKTLYFLAGSVWGLAGLMLSVRGSVSVIVDSHGTWLEVAIAVAAGLLFYWMLFVRISNKHIQRIASLPHHTTCIFAFLDWRGYFLMGLMISGGILLRTSGFVPTSVLGPMYLGMGTPLLLSSVRFFFSGIRNPSPKNTSS